MTSFDELLGATPGTGAAGEDVLRSAMIASLARYKGDSRMHTESDLRIYLAWCAERQLEPLAVRAHVEMCVRWLQEVRRFRPSTVSRRLSVVAGFYRTCVIDGIIRTYDLRERDFRSWWKIPDPPPSPAVSSTTRSSGAPLFDLVATTRSGGRHTRL